MQNQTIRDKILHLYLLEDFQGCLGLLEEFQEQNFNDFLLKCKIYYMTYSFEKLVNFFNERITCYLNTQDQSSLLYIIELVSLANRMLNDQAQYKITKQVLNSNSDLQKKFVDLCNMEIKQKKNWDLIVQEEEKIAQKNKEIDAPDKTIDFFQQIYENASEDQKRAMLKSFQTSNGKVLSTNWNEVKDKDFEGKDKVE